jgi:hypothetical protein
VIRSLDEAGEKLSLSQGTPGHEQEVGIVSDHWETKFGHGMNTIRDQSA